MLYSCPVFAFLFSPVLNLQLDNRSYFQNSNGNHSMQKETTEVHLCAIHGFLSGNEEMVAGLFKVILAMSKLL